MKIVSWNIQWGRGADGQVDLRRTLDTLHRLGPADVICLQEVAENFPGLKGGVIEDGPAFFRHAFPDYVPVYAPGPDVADGQGGRARFGNLVLSRLPVQQVFRHLLPWPAEPSVPSMQRSCAEVVVCGRKGPLRILCTHLEYYSRLQRLAQVEALRDLQAMAARQAEALEAGGAAGADATFGPWPRPASAVLCGDFNLQPDSVEYARLSGEIDGITPHWEDAWRLRYGERPHAPSVGVHGAEWPDRPYCCDFFFVSADLSDRVGAIRADQESTASDHQPVVLDLKL